MTPRLRELEAELADFSTGGWHATTAELKIEGYKMALEDLAPVLAAAQAIVAGEHGFTYSHKLEQALRDTLSKLEAEDA